MNLQSNLDTAHGWAQSEHQRMITTTRGDLDESVLARTVILEDRPDAVVVVVEWRYRGELVRRDLFQNPILARDQSPE